LAPHCVYQNENILICSESSFLGVLPPAPFQVGNELGADLGIRIVTGEEVLTAIIHLDDAEGVCKKVKSIMNA